MVWWVFRYITRRELLVIGAGMAIGVFSLLFLFQSKGVLPYFLPMVAGWLGKRYIHASELSLSTRALTVLRASLSSCFEDFSALALTGGTLVLLLAAWNRLTATTRRLVGCMLVLTLATPLLFNLVGHFAFYYSYLRFIPAAVAFFTVWSELAEHAAACSNQQPFGFATFLSYLTVYASFLAAICLGLPMRLGVSAASARLSPRPELQGTINASIHTNDVVFMDHATFFEVKRVAAVVYDKNYSSTFLHEHIQGHDFTPEEKRSISILIIRPDQAQFTTNFFGGEWQAIGAPFGDSQDFSQLARLPLIGSELAHYGTQPQTERYRLQILRRLP